METLISVIHIITALVLIALVLLQDSKSSGFGAGLGGGGSNSILGATGGATLAQKLTRGAAVVFAITSITLTVVAKKSGSIIENMPTPAAATSSEATGTEPTASADSATPPTTTLPTK